MTADSTTSESRDDSAVKRAVLEAALPFLASEGFSDKALHAGAAAANVSAPEMKRLFPNGGQDLADAFSEMADDQMDAALANMALTEMKIRERIKSAVHARIAALRPHKEAARRAAAFLTMPQNAALALKLLYRTVDRMWRAAGDTSTDFNFYSKRIILAGVYTSTLFRWFNDTGEDEKDTFAFLDARIENVMQFEKFKAEAKDQLSKFPSLTELLRHVGSNRPR